MTTAAITIRSMLAEIDASDIQSGRLRHMFLQTGKLLGISNYGAHSCSWLGYGDYDENGNRGPISSGYSEYSESHTESSW